MKQITINKEPINVDFNNAETDGAIRLHLPAIKEDLKKKSIQLQEGQNVWLTDGEIEGVGIVTFRENIWVAVLVESSVRDVDKNSPYHIENQK